MRQWSEGAGRGRPEILDDGVLFLDLCTDYRDRTTLQKFIKLYTFDMCMLLRVYFSKTIN